MGDDSVDSIDAQLAHYLKTLNATLNAAQAGTERGEGKEQGRDRENLEAHRMIEWNHKRRRKGRNGK